MSSIVEIKQMWKEILREFDAENACRWAFPNAISTFSAAQQPSGYW
jgi:hypothetical protein